MSQVKLEHLYKRFGNVTAVGDTSEDQDQESLYEIVEDEKELDAVLTVFEELLDDVDIER